MMKLHFWIAFSFFIFLFAAKNGLAQTTPILSEKDRAMAEAFIQRPRRLENASSNDSLIVKGDKAANVFRQLQDWEKYLEAKLRTVETLLDNQKHNRALVYIEESMVVIKKYFGEENAYMGWAYKLMGHTALGVANTDRGLLYLEKARSMLLKTLGDQHPEIAPTYHFLGIYYHNVENDYQRALSYFNKAAAILIKASQQHDLAVVYNWIGITYKNLGDVDTGLSYQNKGMALLINSAWEDSPILARIYIYSGYCYYEKGNVKQALDYQQKGLEILIKNNMTAYLPWAYLYEGRYHFETKAWELAFDSYQKALIYKVEDFDNPYINPPLSKFSKHLGEGAELLRILFKKGRTLENIYLYEGNDIQHLKFALETYQLASLWLDLMTEYAYEKSIYNGFLMRISLYESLIRTARQLYTINGDVQYLHQAFETAEKNKSHSLINDLKVVEAKLLSEISDHLLQQEKGMNKQIHFYEKKLYEAEQNNDSINIRAARDSLFIYHEKLDTLTWQLEQDYPEYTALKNDAHTLSIGAIHDHLSEGENMLIEYFTGNDAMYVFTLAQGEITLGAIQNPERVTKKVETVLDILKQNPEKGVHNMQDYQTYRETASELYQLLLAPVLDSTKAALSHLIIVPDGILSYLPFEVLLESKSVEESTPAYNNYQQLPYLIKKYAISYAYSGALLEKNHIKKMLKNNGKCLAMAPGYPDSTLKDVVAMQGNMRSIRGYALSALPGAQKEVKALSSYFDGKFLLGEAATEENFKKESENYSIVHLAMHGLANDENPAFSKLLFTKSGTGNEDDVLYSNELYSLTLNADLVVLSACETGQGGYMKGEGVMSLARGFMGAGPSSVMQTLWGVEDDASAALMAYFYEGLSNGLTKDGALQKAKVRYLNEATTNISCHPFYWAGYVLTGNTEALSAQSNDIWWWIGGSLVLVIGILIVFWKRYMA